MEKWQSLPRFIQSEKDLRVQDGCHKELLNALTVLI
jgi:hypothetical protein